MNIILVLFDSLNKASLEPYGAPFGRTPNIKKFAEKGISFSNHYVGSLPCVPARRELFSGRKDFLFRGWGHLEAFDLPLPQLLEKKGYKTQIITDHYHYWEKGAHGYIESFQGCELVRGQETDPWIISEISELPKEFQILTKYRDREQVLRYYQNVKNFKDEEDFPSPKVLKAASKWIKENKELKPFFLQVECFDPHEPWYSPEPYRSMWTKNIHKNYNFWPPYQDEDKMNEFFEKTSDEELEFIRSQYAGKVSMIDKWFGVLMEAIGDSGIADETVIILTSDHGHDLGEHKSFGKSFPDWDEHANIPLFIQHPGYGTNQTISALTTTVDLYSTILDFADVRNYSANNSQSIVPLLEKELNKIHEYVTYGRFGSGISITDGKVILMQGFNNDDFPLYEYTGTLAIPSLNARIESGYFIPGVRLPVWKIPIKAGGKHDSLFFSKCSGKHEQNHLFSTEDEKVNVLRERLVKIMLEEGTPIEQYARLGLKETRRGNIK